MAANGKNTRKKKQLLIGGTIGLMIATGGIVWMLVPKTPNPSKIFINSTHLNFTVYRTIDCGCCAEYVKYLQNASNLNVTESIIQDLTPYRNINVSSNGPESCHGSHAGTYFVEGHVPVGTIKTLLEDRPRNVGIALPEMPAGSPGTGGIKSAPSEIYALHSNGSMTFFTTV